MSDSIKTNINYIFKKLKNHIFQCAHINVLDELTPKNKCINFHMEIIDNNLIIEKRFVHRGKVAFNFIVWDVIFELNIFMVEKQISTKNELICMVCFFPFQKNYFQTTK